MLSSGKKQKEFLARIGKKTDLPLPSPGQMVKNLASATVDHAKNGFKNIDDDAYLRRRSTCDECEFFRSDERCSVCGCFMKIKARWAASVCPLGKWQVLR